MGGISKFKLLETSQLKAYIADNEAQGIHRAGYNGVASLVPKGLDNNIFVPRYCGMNYEITGIKGLEQNEDQMFEPRRWPMSITHSDRESVTIHQSPTSYKGIEAEITFRVEEPYYIHQKIKLTFTKKLTEKMDFSCLLASYLNEPPNRRCYLKIGEGSGDLEGWIGVTKEYHGAPRYIAHALPAKELTLQEHLDAAMTAPVLPEFEQIRVPLPFYYGLYYDHSFIMMFKEPKNFLFAYSPNGGDVEAPWSPAWDYVLVWDDVQPGETYEWNLCLAVKPFVSRQDIMDEVRRYQQG